MGRFSIALALAALCLGAQAQDARKTVRATTPDEFLRAVAPDVVIVLAPGVYDLGAARSRLGGFAAWVGSGETRALVLRGLRNFSLRAEDPSSQTEIVSPNPDSAVIALENCVDSSVSGLRLAHRARNACAGPVLSAFACSGISVEDCVLDGCGALGLDVDNCDNVAARRVVTSNCGRSGASVRASEFVSFSDCVFRGNAAGPLVLVGEAAELSFVRTVFEGNKGSAILGGIGQPYGPVSFKECTFRSNAIDSWSDGAPSRARGCSFEGNGFASPPEAPPEEEKAEGRGPGLSR